MFEKKKVVLKLEQEKFTKCVICGSEDFIFLLKCYDYFYFRPYGFNLMKCRQCGMVCLNPLPEKSSIYYHADDDKNKTKTKRIDIFNLLNPDRARIVEKFKKPGRILDIGCGSGEFLFNMKSRGWEVFGNESSGDLCNLIKDRFGLQNIYDNDLLVLDFPDKFFDVITLWHVFEHLEYPLESLQKIKKILKDDGLLIIESPNYASCQRKFFKERWFALNVPRHIYQYSPQCLTKLFKSTGLEIFAKNYLVNLRMDFITLKGSILRLFHLEIVPDERERNESLLLIGLKKYKFIYRFLRVSFEIACLALTLILALINCGSTFRVYCRRRA